MHLKLPNLRIQIHKNSKNPPLAKDNDQFVDRVVKIKENKPKSEELLTSYLNIEGDQLINILLRIVKGKETEFRTLHDPCLEKGRTKI